MTPFATHTAHLFIDTKAICHNWRQLDSLTPASCQTGAVVKADAYGLGMVPVAMALYDAGCRIFFTARLAEALILEKAFADAAYTEAEIVIFDGILSGQEAVFHEGRFLPTLNDLSQIEKAKDITSQTGRKIEVILHLDTGMARLGLTPQDWHALQSQTGWSDGLSVRYVMSHLASADDDEAVQNATQLERFLSLTQALDSPLSLANSGGMFLGQGYRCALTRPGLALYGMSPKLGEPADAKDLRSVLRLEADILQIRDIEEGDSVGYGAGFIAPHKMRLATLGIGYADGFLRQYQPHVAPRIHGIACPLIGRISMDSCVVDISHLSDPVICGQRAVIFDDIFTPKELAALSDTISYEIITTLGERVLRHYDDQGY